MNVYIANTQVEFEMENSTPQNFEKFEDTFAAHPFCLQLQFLPLLFAQPEDKVAVTALPSSDYLYTLEKTGFFPLGMPRLVLLTDEEAFKGGTCLSWGPSQQVRRWAEERKMTYVSPGWEISRKINSKAFSFQYSTLPEARLLLNENELRDWARDVPGTKVIKTCFGLSGKGNMRFEGEFPSPKNLTFCQKEWNHGRPMIAEPWLNRILDFSTQCFIHPSKQIEYVGATRFETDQKGTYLGTIAGPEDLLFESLEPFLKEQCQFSLKALKDISEMGFFGPIGIDSFLYTDEKDQSIKLNPIVEMNGRQTMSLVALLLQKRVCPQSVVKMFFNRNGNSSSLPLLPDHLTDKMGKTVKFPKNLYLEK